MDVDTATQITDVRTHGDFKTISFSEFKKTEVKKQILLAIFQGKIEPACYWCAEMVCAGHFTDIWEICLLYLSKHIHLGNPKLAIYLEKRFAVFRNIMQQGMFYDELQLRNHQTIRDMFAEIMCILASSPKKNSLELVKINRQEEFDITNIQERLKAPSVQFAEPIFRKEDPKELWIAINEFAFQISMAEGHLPNAMLAWYWVEWILAFDEICKKKKTKCVCDRRTEIDVEPKYQKEVIWLLWDSLVHTAKSRENVFLATLMASLLKLFCIRFSPSSCKKRRYLIYFAVSCLTEPVMTNIELITDKAVLTTVVKKINTVYTQIKKNEHSPNLDYMFSGLESKRNLQKTMVQMEMMSAMDPALSRSMEEL